MRRHPSRTSSNRQSVARDRRVGSRVQAQQAARRRSRLIVGGVVVVAIALALVIALVAGRDSTSSSSGPTLPMNAAEIVQRVTSIPAATLDAAGAGSVDGTKVRKISGAPLTSGGKPEVLYIGAEYCPFCAAQRWGMVIALSRFGTFSKLGLSYSSSTDVHANTPTFTFHGSTYTSDYVTFTAVETSTRTPDGKGGYSALETLTPDQERIMASLDPQGSIPFLDLGGKYALLSSLSEPDLISGETHGYVLNGLSNPASTIGRSVLGAANLITATICSLTNQQPASVCTSAGVIAAAEQLA